eukprot:TRINITY_DN1344_c0_g3_i1.p1 TRINITY_DN1344_c0_g3~~TRINITY_DN1344_c0_g3_i1.p1  ORF type:complete len:601 (+),score=184.19 TRINITY_DN1344_c0_g3_i1:62-1804(+)
MYLQTLSNEERMQKQQRAKALESRYNPMDLSDIEGAKPVSNIRKISKPKELQEPIPGAQPKKFTRNSSDGVSFSLRTDDIVGAKPKSVKKINTSRVVNPLNPEYSLPQSEERAPSPPSKPARDIMSLDDIEGAKPVHRINTFATRDALDYSDVEGSTSGWRVQRRKMVLEGAGRPKDEQGNIVEDAPRDYLNVKDINGAGVFHTSRVSNPLEPRYVYDVPKGFEGDPEEVAIGELEGSKPRQRKVSKDRPDFSLNVKDISDFKEVQIQYLMKQRESNKVDDIPGAQPKSWTKKYRGDNPLQPNYTLLDGTKVFEDKPMKKSDAKETIKQTYRPSDKSTSRRQKLNRTVADLRREKEAAASSDGQELQQGQETTSQTEENTEQEQKEQEQPKQKKAYTGESSIGSYLDETQNNFGQSSTNVSVDKQRKAQTYRSQLRIGGEDTGTDGTNAGANARTSKRRIRKEQGPLDRTDERTIKPSKWTGTDTLQKTKQNSSANADDDQFNGSMGSTYGSFNGTGKRRTIKAGRRAGSNRPQSSVSILSASAGRTKRVTTPGQITYEQRVKREQRNQEIKEVMSLPDF